MFTRDTKDVFNLIKNHSSAAAGVCLRPKGLTEKHKVTGSVFRTADERMLVERERVKSNMQSSLRFACCMFILCVLQTKTFFTQD